MKNAKSINIAILAMGGEGGGVLADWSAKAAAISPKRRRCRVSHSERVRRSIISNCFLEVPCTAKSGCRYLV